MTSTRWASNLLFQLPTDILCSRLSVVRDVRNGGEREKSRARTQLMRCPPLVLVLSPLFTNSSCSLVPYLQTESLVLAIPTWQHCLFLIMFPCCSVLLTDEACLQNPRYKADIFVIWMDVLISMIQIIKMVNAINCDLQIVITLSEEITVIDV